MTPEAILLLIATLLLVWGGLIASLVALRTLPVPTQEETEENISENPENKSE